MEIVLLKKPNTDLLLISIIRQLSKKGWQYI